MRIAVEWLKYMMAVDKNGWSVNLKVALAKAQLVEKPWLD
jgi:hypothetical protein